MTSYLAKDVQNLANGTGEWYRLWSRGLWDIMVFASKMIDIHNTAVCQRFHDLRQILVE